MLMASLLFAIMNVLVKSLDRIPVAQIVFMRSLVMLFFVLLMLKKRRVSVFGRNKRLLILRGVFGSVGIAFFFYTLHQMPLVSAVVVHYLTPIFTTLMAFILAREKVHPLQWLFFILCFIGIYIIKGFDPRVDWLALVIGVVGTLAASAAYNIIGLLKDKEHHLTVMFYFPAVTIPLVLIYIFVTGEWVNGTSMEWGKLVLVGVLTYGAQYFLTRSYQLGVVNKVSIVSYVGVIYALLFGWFLFGELIPFGSVIGITMVLTGVIANVLFRKSSDSKST